MTDQLILKFPTKINKSTSDIFLKNHLFLKFQKIEVGTFFNF